MLIDLQLPPLASRRSKTLANGCGSLASSPGATHRGNCFEKQLCCTLGS